MPRYKVTAPDGNSYYVNAPEGATQAQVVAYAKANYKKQAPRQEDPSLLDRAADVAGSVGRFGGGVVKGVARTLDGAAALLATPFGQRDEVLSKPGFRGATEGIPSNRAGEFTGEVLGSTLLTRGMGGPVTQGALSGAALSDERELGGLVKDAVIGGVTGKVADVGVKAISKAVSPAVEKGAQALRKRGVRITPGQALGGAAKAREDKMMSWPFVGDKIAEARRQGVDDFNRVAVNKSLAAIDDALPDNVSTGRQAIKYAGDRLSQEYKRVIPKASLAVDEQLAADVAGWGDNVTNSGELSPESVTKLRKIVDNTVLSRLKGGRVGGESFRQVDERLGALARRYSSGSPEDQAISEAFSDLQEILRSGVDRTSPEAGAALRKINEGWASLVRVEGAAANAKGGIFTPGQLRTAAKVADSSVRKRAAARGEALMIDLADEAQDILPASVPDSGTSGREAFNMADPRFWGGMALSPFYNPQTQNRIADVLMGPRPAAAQSLSELLRRLPAAQAGSVAVSGPSR